MYDDDYDDKELDREVAKEYMEQLFQTEGEGCRVTLPNGEDALVDY